MLRKLGIGLLIWLCAVCVSAEEVPTTPPVHAGETVPLPDPSNRKDPPKPPEGEREPAGASVDLIPTPYESFQARRPVSPSGTPRPGDPEYPRTYPEDGQGETVLEQPSGRQTTFPETRPGDPEFGRSWPADGPVLVASEQGRKRAASALLLPPRFALGEGPDEGDRVDWAPEPETVAEAAPVPEVKRHGIDIDKLPGEITPEMRKRLEDVQAQMDRVAELRRQQDTAHARLNGSSETTVPKGGEPTNDRPNVNVFNRPLGEIAGQVIDAETRAPIPARVRIVDATGVPAESRVPDLGFWCNGHFRVPVVAGNVHVEVSAGRFCTAFSRDVVVQAGLSLPLEIPLLRPPVLRFEKEGWYVADLDWAVRARRGEQRLWGGAAPDLSDAVLALRSEGVRIAGLGLPEVETQTPEERLAGFAAYERQDVLLISNFPGPQHSRCGSTLGIGLAEWGGLPRYLGDPRRPLVDYLEAMHQGGGLTLFTELRGRRAVNPQATLRGYFQRLCSYGFFEENDKTSLLYAPAELPYATVTGPMYDGLAFDGSDVAEGIWFNLLNQGYSIPVVGSDGGSLEAGRAPFGQTLIKLGNEVTREAVVKACREGHSMVSFGPAVFAEILERSRGPGDRLPADGRALTLRIRAFSSLDEGATLEGFEILRNGEAIHTEKCEGGMTELQDFRFPITEQRDAWYMVRLSEGVGKAKRTIRTAWTNPIYFDTQARIKPSAARSRVHGTMRSVAGAPLSGTVTVLEPGQADREQPIGVNGRFDLQMLSCGTLIFSAKQYDPTAWKPVQHPKVQRALGAIHAERGGLARRQLTKPSLFSEWRFVLADLQTDVHLAPQNRPATNTAEGEPEPKEEP